jgi:hypothetical protein
LHKRAMSLFAKNPALINPVLEAAWIDVSNLNLEEVAKLDNMEINWDKCELTLDINGKKYTLSSWMKFWFFTQCVNHTIILDDISVTNEDGTSVTFNSWVWENGHYVEWNKSTIVSTTEVGISGSIIVHDGRKPKKTNQPPEDNPSSQPGSDPTNIPDDVTTDPTERTTDTPTIPETPTTPETPTIPDYSDFTSNDGDWLD